MFWLEHHEYLIKEMGAGPSRMYDYSSTIGMGHNKLVRAWQTSFIRRRQLEAANTRSYCQNIITGPIYGLSALLLAHDPIPPYDYMCGLSWFVCGMQLLTGLCIRSERKVWIQKYESLESEIVTLYMKQDKVEGEEIENITRCLRRYTIEDTSIYPYFFSVNRAEKLFQKTLQRYSESSE